MQYCILTKIIQSNDIKEKIDSMFDDIKRSNDSKMTHACGFGHFSERSETHWIIKWSLDGLKNSKLVYAYWW